MSAPSRRPQGAQPIKLKKAIPVSVFLAGLGLAAYSLAEFAGGSIPFQDPTPEMLRQQSAELDSAKLRFFIGAAIFFIGLAVSVIQAIHARKR